MQAVRYRLRSESATVILNGETQALHQHLALRKAQGFRINLNHLAKLSSVKTKPGVVCKQYLTI